MQLFGYIWSLSSFQVLQASITTAMYILKHFIYVTQGINFITNQCLSLYYVSDFSEGVYPYVLYSHTNKLLNKKSWLGFIEKEYDFCHIHMNNKAKLIHQFPFHKDYLLNYLLKLKFITAFHYQKCCRNVATNFLL